MIQSHLIYVSELSTSTIVRFEKWFNNKRPLFYTAENKLRTGSLPVNVMSKQSATLY